MKRARTRVQRRPCMACCCSTSRWACRATTRCRGAKRLLRAEKAGHTGTLDPLATGLLPLCFGAATKFAQLSLDADKTYRATLRLGHQDDHRRRRGRSRSRTAPVAVSREQLPAWPLHRRDPPGAADASALKHDGKAAVRIRARRRRSRTRAAADHGASTDVDGGAADH